MSPGQSRGRSTETWTTTGAWIYSICDILCDILICIEIIIIMLLMFRYMFYGKEDGQGWSIGPESGLENGQTYHNSRYWI